MASFPSLPRIGAHSLPGPLFVLLPLALVSQRDVYLGSDNGEVWRLSPE
jgi:hypothetical protein